MRWNLLFNGEKIELKNEIANKIKQAYEDIVYGRDKKYSEWLS